MYPPSQSQLHSFVVSRLSLVSCWSNVTPLMNWRERQGWHVQAPGLRRELSLNWKAALVPSQTDLCGSSQGANVWGLPDSSKSKRNPAPYSLFKKMGAHSQNSDWCVFSLALTVRKDTGSWKVASRRLLSASPCACREVSLSFWCKTRLFSFLNIEVRTQTHH